MALIRSSFNELLKLPIEEINVDTIENWRIKKRKEKGTKASSVNRQVTALKSALNWGVDRGILETNPMARLQSLQEDDSDTKVRYLHPEERERLFAVLDAREERIRTGRDNHNEWLEDRAKTVLPDLRKCKFVDHLQPIIIVALNTGIRRGSLLKLRWSDIDFKECNLTVRPLNEKNGKLIYVPMNQLLTKTLIAWKEQTAGDDNGLVFPSPRTGNIMNDCKKAWAKILEDANIKNFRWHDMRHDFASQLVLRGTDLNVVRELLGHSDMKMTLRYAHLAPQVKRAAVDMLG